METLENKRKAVEQNRSADHKKKNNRFHRHRGRKPGNRPDRETEMQSGIPMQDVASEANEKMNSDNRRDKSRDRREKAADESARKKDGNGTPEKNGKKDGNKDGKKDGGKRNHKDRRHGGRGNRRQRFSEETRLYDPYEEPAPEELSLAELRARIVLRSADDASDGDLTHRSEQTADKETAAPISPADLPPIWEEPAEPAEPEETVEVVGIRFRSAGKMYYFDPNGISLRKGDFAIVETARGPEFGDVCMANTRVNVRETVSPLRPVLRAATEEDILHNEENRQKEQDALDVCRQKIEAHKLEMKLIDVQYAFDNSKLLFYFTADGRVDFRELVRDLASVFRTRIELRQIGIRDEAKMLGGIGACGRPLCCSTFLPDFAQVSIKMAKEQNLSINSAKISGVCGRLMCCLRFESDVYAEEIRLTPANDSLVKTEDGIGTVISSNPLAGTVRVVLKDNPDTPPKQYHRDDISVIGKAKREKNGKGTDKEDEAEDCE